MNQKPCDTCSEKHFMADINECTGCKDYFIWKRTHSDDARDKRISEIADNLRILRGY